MGAEEGQARQLQSSGVDPGSGRVTRLGGDERAAQPPKGMESALVNAGRVRVRFGLCAGNRKAP